MVFFVVVLNFFLKMYYIYEKYGLHILSYNIINNFSVRFNSLLLLLLKTFSGYFFYIRLLFNVRCILLMISILF
jgi:hypothetical protein